MKAPTRADSTTTASTQKRMTTGVTVDCPCGATDVPMAWSKGRNGSVHLYRHVKGKPWRGKAARGEKCTGPEDLFTYMLAYWGLLLFEGDDGRVRRVTLEGRADEVRELIARERSEGQGTLF